MAGRRERRELWTLDPSEMPKRPESLEDIEEAVWQITQMIATGRIGSTEGREVLHGLRVLNEVVGLKDRLRDIEKRLEKAKK